MLAVSPGSVPPAAGGLGPQATITEATLHAVHQRIDGIQDIVHARLGQAEDQLGQLFERAFRQDQALAGAASEQVRLEALLLQRFGQTGQAITAVAAALDERMAELTRVDGQHGESLQTLEASLRSLLPLSARADQATAALAALDERVAELARADSQHRERLQALEASLRSAPPLAVHAEGLVLFASVETRDVHALSTASLAQDRGERAESGSREADLSRSHDPESKGALGDGRASAWPSALATGPWAPGQAMSHAPPPLDGRSAPEALKTGRLGDLEGAIRAEIEHRKTLQARLRQLHEPVLKDSWPGPGLCTRRGADEATASPFANEPAGELETIQEGSEAEDDQSHDGQPGVPAALTRLLNAASAQPCG